MSDDVIVCWKCGNLLEVIHLPLSRTEECPSCSADLHVCRMCRFYDPGVGDACREPVAERVTDKTRANFCGYLELRKNAHSGGMGSTSSEDLNALFGLEDPGVNLEGERSSLDQLFGLGDETKD